MRIINYKNLNQIYIIKNFYNINEASSLFNFEITNNDFIFGNLGKIIPSFFLKYKAIKKDLKIYKLQKLLSNYFKNSVIATDHSDFHVETFGNWHNDCGPNNSYLPKNFYKNNHHSNIFKCAIFNQVGIKSPTQFFINNNVHSIPLYFGDVLIFRIELTHRSRPISKYVKLFSWFYYFKNKFDLKKNKLDRKAIFFTLGYKGKVLDYFYRKNLDREISQYKKAIHFS